MLHLNTNVRTRSIGNVWDWSKGEVWAVLMGLMESREILLCKSLSGKRTYVSPDVAVSLIRLAEDRFADMAPDLHQVYDLIRTEGPLARGKLSEFCGRPARYCSAILDELVDRLLITPLECERHLHANWGELAYWTVDEWLLNAGIDAAALQATEEDEEIVLSAAARCVMSNDARELARVLGWPTAKAKTCLERLWPAQLPEVTEPIRLGE